MGPAAPLAILALIIKAGVKAAIKKYGKKAVIEAQKKATKTKPKTKPKKKETAAQKREREEYEAQSKDNMNEEMSIRNEMERDGLRMSSGGLTTKKYMNPVTVVNNLKKKK